MLITQHDFKSTSWFWIIPQQRDKSWNHPYREGWFQESSLWFEGWWYSISIQNGEMPRWNQHQFCAFIEEIILEAEENPMNQHCAECWFRCDRVLVARGPKARVLSARGSARVLLARGQTWISTKHSADFKGFSKALRMILCKCTKCVLFKK